MAAEEGRLDGADFQEEAPPHPKTDIKPLPFESTVGVAGRK